MEGHTHGRRGKVQVVVKLQLAESAPGEPTAVYVPQCRYCGKAIGAQHVSMESAECEVSGHADWGLR